jgi:Domain of unknown function (DUF222)
MTAGTETTGAGGAGGAGPVFGSPGEALEVMRSAVRYLASADYVEQPAEVLAGVLAGMEEIDAGQAAVRGRAGWAFTIAEGYTEFAQRGLGAFYQNCTKVTRAAAGAHRAWTRRREEHPQIVAALGELDVITESWAREVCSWTGKLPDEFVQQADEIMVQAARTGVDRAGLARIAAELRARLAPPDEDDGGEPGRGLRLELTLDGAGILDADLTPACAAKVKAVLEPLSAPAGPGDDRSYKERMHDALETAMTRLLAARLVPQSQGAPTTALVHIHFADLLAMAAGSVLAERWVGEVTAQWAAERAGAHAEPGDGGAWLTGDTARAIAVDAMLVPVVTATLDVSHLDDLVGLCGQLDRHRQAEGQAAAEAAAAEAGTQAGDGAGAEAGDGAGAQDAGSAGSAAGPSADGAGKADTDSADAAEARGADTGGADTGGAENTGAAGRGAHAAALEARRAGLALERRRLERAILGTVIAIASGTASYLRRNMLGQVGLGGPSLPLDVGETDHIPPQVRRAVTLRDRGRCAFPGGCGTPAMRCNHHHTDPRSKHGRTSVAKIGLFCEFHHLIVIHQWGWDVRIEPDGTMTARRPDGTIFKRSHDPP